MSQSRWLAALHWSMWCLLALVLAAPTAFADGMNRRAVQAAPAPFSWTGFYVGAQAGYTWVDAEHTFSNGAPSDHSDPRGGVFGGHVGYNMQSGIIVYGVEADLGYSGLDHSAGGITEKNRFNGSVRGRVGYDLNPFLLYGTAGLAATNNKVSGLGDSDSKMAYGYTVGVGAEAFVTSNITARVEYRFSDYQDKDYNLGGTNVSRGYDEQSVKVGIGVKF